jgi:TRAP-type C4-dicarboxylate transport system substrate-binding protein
MSLNSQTIKFATLAPEGTTWMKVMKAFGESIKEATNGEVKFKIYPGSVQGDDKDVLRKIRINQLHSAGFTGVGLGEILPEVRILDAPFLFRNHQEVDYVKTKFLDRFAEGFEKKGFILLGWAEIGFVYIFTNKPVNKLDDFKGVKMWMWEGDPLAEATFKSFGISPIPLSIVDVLTSLQTGLVDGVYTAPLACVSMQWFTKIKYVLDIPLANANGAVLLSKRMFNKLSPEHQQIVRDKGKEYFRQLVQKGREDNAKSMEAILSYGIEKININDDATRENYEKIGAEARKMLVGKLYDQSLLTDIEQAVREVRQEEE